MKYSETAIEILTNGFGYRDDNYSGQGIEDLESIVKYEVLELQNRDILYTCRKLYALDYDMRNLNKSIEVVLNFFYSFYESKILYAKWLTLEKYVVYLYGKNISKYQIPKDSLIVSDLNIDGILFVSNYKFEREE